MVDFLVQFTSRLRREGRRSLVRVGLRARGDPAPRAGDVSQPGARTARHPAMLFYLDNWLSTRPDFHRAAGPIAAGNRANENYARELMELHTLGVDGGYTQRT